MNQPQTSVKTAHSEDARQAILLNSGLGALGRLAERWALTDDARSRLINSGEVSGSTARASLQRMSHILGIYRAATALFRHREADLLQWLRAANTAPPFAGLSPIEVIVDGRNLYQVRGYLECQLVA